MECSPLPAPVKHGAPTDGCADDPREGRILDQRIEVVNHHFGDKVNGHFGGNHRLALVHLARSSRTAVVGEGPPKTSLEAAPEETIAR
jgi:hypothetical protein